MLKLYIKCNSFKSQGLLLDAMGGHTDMTSYAELRLVVNFLVFQVGIPKCGGFFFL